MMDSPTITFDARTESKKNVIAVGVAKIMAAALFCIAAPAHAVVVNQQVHVQTISEIAKAEAAFNLPIWSWVGYIEGNSEPDPKHHFGKRATFLAHREVSTERTHYYIVWFHGMNGFSSEFTTRTYPALKFLIESGKSFTWIHPELPWSDNSNQIDKRVAWSIKSSFQTFMRASIVTTPPIAYNKKVEFIIVGHSRGGKAIANAAAGKDLCAFNPKAVVWSDATYSRWLDRAWASCLQNSEALIEIWYLRNTQTQASVDRMIGNIPATRLRVNPLTAPWYHGKIGDMVMLWTKVF